MLSTWSWRSRNPSRTERAPSSQPFRNPVTRWLRPSSWTAASADRSSRFVPIRLAVSTIPTRLLRSKSSGSGRRNGSASKRRSWPLRLAIVSWPRSSNAYQLPLKEDTDLLAVAPLPDRPPTPTARSRPLAKRHKVEAKKDSASAQELLAKQVGTYDEAELCKLLLEISLLDSAYQRSTASRDDVLMDAAKRYRVDTEKLQKAVAEEFVAKRDKKTKAKAKPKNRKTAA